jgi:flavin reductase (DIM6/NTAB) family NADH-FMN oxidoreductase RutF
VTDPLPEEDRQEGPLRLFLPETLSGSQRYQLLTSLVVPRPIAWISTQDRHGRRNLAPFSYFMAVSASPLIVGVSIGHRRSPQRGSLAPKDTLANILETGVFCVNIVTDLLLEQMNASAEDVPPDIDEFELARVSSRPAIRIDCPAVAEAPATLECRLFKEVDLGGAPNTLILGRVVGVTLSSLLSPEGDDLLVEPELLGPVGRLGGDRYTLLGEQRHLKRPGR